MYKLTSLILVALSLVACGGEPFGADSADIEQIGGADSAAVAGEAGSPDTGDAGAGYGGTASGGSSSVAGKPPVGGSAPHAGTGPGGSSSAGIGTGGIPTSCEFDEAKLVSALPKSFVWNDFVYTNGEFCVTCRDEPCDTLGVISWGVPMAGENEYEFIYAPNAESPMVSVELGVNDGMCTSEKSCGVKLYLSTVKVTVARSAQGWVISDAVVSMAGDGNACLSSYPGGSNTGTVASIDFAKDAEVALTGLQIPCD